VKDLSKRRRDRHEITAEILKSAWNGALKTQIMYQAKLSYYQLQLFLPKLVKDGLLESSELKERKRTKQIFKTTEEGKHFVENFELLKKL